MRGKSGREEERSHVAAVAWENRGDDGDGGGGGGGGGDVVMDEAGCSIPLSVRSDQMCLSLSVMSVNQSVCSCTMRRFSTGMEEERRWGRSVECSGSTIHGLESPPSLRVPKQGDSMLTESCCEIKESERDQTSF